MMTKSYQNEYGMITLSLSNENLNFCYHYDNLPMQYTEIFDL